MVHNRIALRLFTAALLALLPLLAVAQTPDDYTWTRQSVNSSESMPCGGGDVGLNVWVERGDVLFYAARPGCFDENNTLLKLGRWRIRLSEPFAEEGFRQTLVVREGYVVVADGRKSLMVWADTGKPVVHVEVSAARGTAPISVEAVYESWRSESRAMTKREAFQSSWKFGMPPEGAETTADSIFIGSDGSLTFFHQNRLKTVFDYTVEQQQMGSLADSLYNPLGGLIFGGRMTSAGMRFAGKTSGTYASTDFTGWRFVSARPRRTHHLQITFATAKPSPSGQGRKLLLKAIDATERQVSLNRDREQTRRWWRAFWQRSFIALPSGSADHGQATLLRNYTLFRYMMGCNSKGEWPTKFNGGLFTFDPEYVKPGEDDYRLTPDFRNWGGGVHTAQNQRLLYWPLLKTGDTDLLRPQLDFYLRLLPTAEMRSRHYWGHEGACFTEQLENFGLPNPAEYGRKRPAGFDPGMERNAWLEYEWDTALEFCQMALLARRYDKQFDSRPYLKMALSVLTFFHEHYRMLASQRGAKTLDDSGHLVIYPGSGCETFKMAYNPSSTTAGLRAVAQELSSFIDELSAQGDSLPETVREKVQAMLAATPPVAIRDSMIAPAEAWARVQNVETAQLYPVFPWRQYGVGRPGIDVARRTYENDTLAVKFRSHIGWKQDNIWAACLGMTDEAERLTRLKLADGPYRFPAFWGPGYDWSPDHNWGGSAMIGLQEMLLQETPGGELMLLPAWPKEWDVSFRLHATGGRIVEATMKGGQVSEVKIREERP